MKILKKWALLLPPEAPGLCPIQVQALKDLNLWSSDRDSPWRSLNSGGSQSLENGKKGVDPI